jgi:sec-independent protein translocase protein TatA
MGTLLFISGSEIFVIMVVILLLFGADKLPEMARGIGKGMRDFRKAADDIRRELEDSTRDIRNDMKDIQSDINKDVDEIKDNVNGHMNDIKSDYESTVNDFKSNVDNNVNEVKNNLNDNVNDFKSTVENNVNEMKSDAESGYDYPSYDYVHYNEPDQSAGQEPSDKSTVSDSSAKSNSGSVKDEPTNRGDYSI